MTKDYKKKFQPVLEELFKEIKELYNDLSSQDSHRENLAEGRDVVTEIDTAVTELVSSYFNQLDENYKLESEELNKSENNGRQKECKYTVILDEIDGTMNMRNDISPFGPIVGIAEGEDPAFQDIVAAGFLNIKEDTFYEAYLGSGAYNRNGFDQTPSAINVNNTTTIEDNDFEIIVDQNMLGKAPELAEAWKYKSSDHGSMGQELAWIADGTKDGLITGGYSNLKDNNTAEEIGSLYLLIKEAGGAVTDWKANDIAEEKLRLSSKKNHDIIAAATIKLAEEISDQIIPEKYRK